MTSRQASEILALFRPDRDSRREPPFAEAFDAMERDDDLATWFERQTALDQRIRSSLSEITPPVGLKTRLLASRPPARRSFWQSPIFAPVFAAAMILLVAVGVWQWRAGNRSFEAYRREMVKFVAEEYDIEVKVESFDAIRAKLAEMGWPADYEVPKTLLALHVEGGCARQWHSAPVSLICLETVSEGDVWLYVIRRQDLPDAPAESSPRVEMVHGLPAATWSKGDNVYLMVVEAGMAAMQRYLN